MTELLHRNVSPAENHGIVSWVVANSNALTSLPVTAADVNKVAKVGTGALTSYYVLTSNSPVVWTLLNNAGEGSTEGGLTRVEALPQFGGLPYAATLLKKAGEPFTLELPHHAGILQFSPVDLGQKIYISKLVVFYGMDLEEFNSSLELLPEELGYLNLDQEAQIETVGSYGSLFTIQRTGDDDSIYIGYLLPFSLFERSDLVAKMEIHLVNPTNSSVSITSEGAVYLEASGIERHWSPSFGEVTDYVLEAEEAGILPAMSTTIYTLTNGMLSIAQS